LLYGFEIRDSTITATAANRHAMLETELEGEAPVLALATGCLPETRGARTRGVITLDMCPHWACPTPPSLLQRTSVPLQTADALRFSYVRWEGRAEADCHLLQQPARRGGARGGVAVALPVVRGVGAVLGGACVVQWRVSSTDRPHFWADGPPLHGTRTGHKTRTTNHAAQTQEMCPRPQPAPVTSNAASCSHRASHQPVFGSLCASHSWGFDALW
jgi:hypothetical protein